MNMEVTQVIKELLFDHNCVIVPGFGAFIANEVRTKVHPINNVYSPPSKTIAFNRSLKKNDGLLIKEYALFYKVDDKQSEKAVISFANELEYRIKNEKIVRIEEIGTFQLDEESNIQFRSDDSINFQDDSFGLPDLYLKPIQKEINMTEQPVTPRRAPVKNNETSKEKKAEQKTDSSNKLFLIIPIALLLIGIASLFIVKDEQGDVYMASLFPSMKSTHMEMSDDIMLDEESIENELNADDELGVDAISVDGKRFHIIAGVFSNKENADRLVSQATNGEILNIDGYYKVSISSYDSESTAEASLSNFTNEFGADIWVLEE